MEPDYLMHLQDLSLRPRRNRRNATFRAAFQETVLSPSNFILPVFIHEGEFRIVTCCIASGLKHSQGNAIHF
jgi:delta-aminolevulinic acid dehydratase/porphobilinogen synthase